MVASINFIKAHIDARRLNWVKKSDSSNNEELKNAIPYNISNPALPVIKTRKDAEQETLKSALIGWFGFDVALKSLGLVYSKAKQGVNHLRKIPTDPKSVLQIKDRFFTPNIIGLDLGSRAASELSILKNPIKALQTTLGNVVSKEAASKPFSSLLKSSGFTGWIVMGVLFGIGDTIKAFKQGFVPGVKQLGKTVASTGINAAGFVTGELLGSTTGALIGAAVGGPLGAQIGGWVGGMAAGCAASYFADKCINAPLGLTRKAEDAKKINDNKNTEKAVYA